MTASEAAIFIKLHNMYHTAVYKAAYIRDKADPEQKDYALFTATAYADGYIRGYGEEIIKSVRTMLSKNDSIEKIMRVTGLTPAEIESLSN